jgi:predicted HNH restriction endonuclease
MICSSCEKDLNETEFYIKKEKGKEKIGHQSYCKKCFNKFCVERWVKRKKDAIEYKGGKCELCGYKKYYGALVFHHVDPMQKDFEWTHLRKKSWDKIKAELDKCMMLCSNCHSEIHAKDATGFDIEAGMALPTGLEPA